MSLNDELANILGDSRYSKRQDIWLWLTLNNYGCNLGSLEQSGPNIRDKMANCLKAHPHLINQVKLNQEKQLLPDDSFKWINEGKRQIAWLTFKLAEASGYMWLIKPSNLHGMDLLFSIIDGWQTDITHKQFTLSDTREKWEKHKKGDREFKWFKDNNRKSTIAWEWLNKNTPSLVSTLNPFESYEDLLIFFDNTYLTHEQKTLYIEKIKKRWSQQTYRENLKGKAQYNFVLSDKAIANLDKLATLHEISRAKVLEILIEMEIKNNNHIPERIMILKLLNNA